MSSLDIKHIPLALSKQNVVQMAQSPLYRKFGQVLARWPVDLLRPEVSFPKAMQKRLDQKYLPSSGRPQDNVVANEALATVPTPPKIIDAAETEQYNVLNALLDNRYTKKYPLSERMMKPASNPKYYEDLVTELQQAPRRSWFASMINKWRGFLRFQ